MASNILYTDSQNQEQQTRENLSEIGSSVTTLGASALIATAAGHYIDKNERARSLMAQMPGAARYQRKYEEASNFAVARGVVPIDLTAMYSNQSFQKSMHSMISSFEELSPMGVLKTLQVSNFIEPFVKPTATKMPDVHITGTAVSAYEDLYRTQLRANGRQLTDVNIKYGFMLRDGVLYNIKPDGTVDYVDPVLKNAKIVSSHVKMGERISPNRILQKYANIQGSKVKASAFNAEQAVVIGNNSRTKFVTDWARAYLRQGLEIGYKTMDNPLGGLEDLVKATGVNQLPFADSRWYENLKEKLNMDLGTNGDYSLSTRESLKRMSKNIAGKSALAYIGYQGVNQVLNTVTDENSIWHDGVLSGLTHLYANSRLSFAKHLADPFQDYKQEQEYAAEGSTSLLTLAGFPIAGATLGASLSYYKRLSDSARLGVEEATSISETAAGHGFTDKIFKRIGISDMAPFKSNALKGAILGAAFISPFLPGALIGRSSEELRKEFSGEEEVANRANRWWLMGGNRYEGDHIKNYQASWVARTLKNTKNEALYDGDMKKKLDYDPIYSPLKYLKNPYRYEQDTQDSRPYPVWGMEVTYGSFLGKAFQATIGEIIKPTILSPQFKEELAKGAIEGDGEEVHVGRTGVVTTRSELEKTGSKGDAPAAIKNDNGSYSVRTEARPKDRKLIEAGMMQREDDAYVNEVRQPLQKAYSAVGDFVGLKGFIGNTVLNSLGIDLETTQRQLARSGSAETIAGSIKESNLGDIMGLGEFQRRMVPTSASSKQDSVNPLRNTVAPSWLPKDESKYYIDFGKGDFWNKVDNAEARLPGKGYATLHEELKGVNPEDYPLVHKYKILADVAKGSEEHLALRKQVMDKVQSGAITGKDKDLFYQTLEQEQEKAKKRKFNEYRTEEEKQNLSTGGKILNKLWEVGAHNSETFLEPLTPLRPASKLIHARSAIEDYNKTMLQGPDTGIWTNPYEHFARVSWNRFKDTILPGVQKPIEATERDNVEEYFDKLEYLKARRNNDTNAALKTTVGRSFAGISNQNEMNKFKSSLSKDQQLYVDSFARETDPEKRKKILEMLPSDVAMGYMDIWDNVKIAEQAKASNMDVKAALREEYSKKTQSIVKAYNLEDTSDKTDDGKKRRKSRIDPDVEKRLRAADIEAERYVDSKTGVPSKDWKGWDPRLSMDDLKLRTLTVGKADIYRHGFWEHDQKRNQRIVALDDEQEVSTKYREIKKRLRDDNLEQEMIKRSLFEKGIITDRVKLTPASQNDVRITIKQEDK